MSIGTYGLIGSRAAQIYGREDTAGERTSDRIQARIDDRINRRLASARGGIVDRPALPPPPAAPPMMQSAPAQMPGPTDQQILEKGTGYTAPVLETVGAFGNLLDVPGSVVRDFLTWVPGGIPMRNPGDQLLPWNWTSSEGRTTEEELLESGGFYDDGPADDRSTLTSIGRFVGELGLGIALDPLTYTSGGLTAAFKASKAASGLKRAGLVSDDLTGAASMNERLIKAGSEKAGRKVGKREAAFYATPRDIVKTVIDEDTVGKSASARKAASKRYDEALRQDILKGGEKVKKSVKDAQDKALTDAYYTFKLPFTDRGKVSFMKGEKGKAIARTMDKVEDAVKFGEFSPVKFAAPIFNPALRGRPKTAAAQRQALKEADRLVEAEAAARETVFQAKMEIDNNPLMLDTEGDVARRSALTEAMTEYMEDIDRPREKVLSVDFEGKEIERMRPTDASYSAWRQSFANKGGVYSELDASGVLDQLDILKKELRNSLQYAQESGVRLNELDDEYASYLTRNAQIKDVASPSKRQKGRKAYDPDTEFAIKREDSRRNIVGGTATLQRMSRDARFAGKREKYTDNEWSGVGDALYKSSGTEGSESFLDVYGDKLIKLNDKQKRQLFDSVTEQPAAGVEAGVGFYSDDIVGSVLRGISSANAAAARASGLKKFIKDQAVLRTPDKLDQLTLDAIDAFDGDTLDPGTFYTVENALRSLAREEVDAFSQRIKVMRLAGNNENDVIKSVQNPRVVPDGTDVRKGGDDIDPTDGIDPDDGGGQPPSGGDPPSSPAPETTSPSGGASVDTDDLEALKSDSALDDAIGLLTSPEEKAAKKKRASKKKQSSKKKVSDDPPAPKQDAPETKDPSSPSGEMVEGDALESAVSEPGLDEAINMLDSSSDDVTPDVITSGLRKIASDAGVSIGEGDSAESILSKISDKMRSVKAGTDEIPVPETPSAPAKGRRRSKSKKKATTKKAEPKPRTPEEELEFLKKADAAKPRWMRSEYMEQRGPGREYLIWTDTHDRPYRGQKKVSTSDVNSSVMPIEALRPFYDAVNATLNKEKFLRAFGKESFDDVTDQELVEFLEKRVELGKEGKLGLSGSKRSKANKALKAQYRANALDAAKKKVAKGQALTSRQRNDLRLFVNALGVEVYYEAKATRYMLGMLADKDMPQWARESIEKFARGEDVDPEIMRAIKQNERLVLYSNNVRPDLDPIPKVENQKIWNLVDWSKIDDVVPDEAWNKEVSIASRNMRKEYSDVNMPYRKGGSASTKKAAASKAAREAVSQSVPQVAKKPVAVEEAAEAAVNDMTTAEGRNVSVSEIAEARDSDPATFEEAASNARVVDQYTGTEEAALRTIENPKSTPNEVKDAEDALKTVKFLRENDRLLEEQEAEYYARVKEDGFETEEYVDDRINATDREGGFDENGRMIEYQTAGLSSVETSLKAVARTAAKRTGTSKSSSFGMAVDMGSSGYRPILGSASEDVSAIIDEQKLPHQTLEQFIKSNVPALQGLKMLLGENGQYGAVLRAAREHDRTQRRLSANALRGASEQSLRKSLKSAGVEAPAGMTMASPEGYDFMMQEASRLSKEGNPGASLVVSSIANPLNDEAGNLLGSRYIQNYSDPLAVAKLAEVTADGSYLKEHGYTDLGELISDKPEVFSFMVNGLRSRVDNSVSSGVKFGNPESKTNIFYQEIEDLFDQGMDEVYGPEGFFELPFPTKTAQFIEGMRDGARIGLKQIQGPKAEELFDLQLEDFFASGQNGLRTIRELREHLNAITPVVRVVNLRKTNRLQFPTYTSPGGDPLSYFEILIKGPPGGRGGKYQRHWESRPLPEAQGLQGEPVYDEETIDSSKNIYAHIRANVATDADGNNILRIQELQSDLLQDKRKFEQALADLELFDNAFGGGPPEWFVKGKFSDRRRYVNRFDGSLKRAIEKGVYPKVRGVDSQGRKTWTETPKSPLRERLVERRIETVRKVWRDQDTVRNINSVLRRSGMLGFEKDTPFQKSYMQLGLKTALYMAVKQGLDGIALIDGQDIGRVVGADEEAQQGIRKSYLIAMNTFFKTLKKVDSNAKVTVTNFAPQAYVDAETMKLSKIIGAQDAYLAGTTKRGEPIIINRDESGVYNVIVDGAFEELGYEGVDQRLPEFIDRAETLSDAKEIAAEVYNSGGNRGLRDPELENAALDFEIETGIEVNLDNAVDDAGDDAGEYGFTRNAQKIMFTDALREYALKDQTMYQRASGGTRARAAIKFPTADAPPLPPEDWIKSNFKTLIVAFDHADPLSYAHEMGHLFRKYLGHAEPKVLAAAEEAFGVVDGNWDEYAANRVIGKSTNKEEIFADSFMEWVRLGGKTEDRGLQSLYEKMRRFMLESYNKIVKGQEVEKRLTPEMHQFFDDVFGDLKYAKKSPMSVTDVLDSYKYASPAILANIAEEMGPDTVMAAQDAAFQSTVNELRTGLVGRLAKRDKISLNEADARIPVFEEIYEDLMSEVSKERGKGKGSSLLPELPESIDVPLRGTSGSIKIKTPGLRQAFNQMQVPAEVGEDIRRIWDVSRYIETGEYDFVSATDAITNVFKSSVTAVWPAFHVRNFTSGMIQNALNDIFDPTASQGMKYIKPYQDAANILVGNDLKDLSKIPAFENMDSEQATAEFKKLAFMFGVFDSPGQHRDIYGIGGNTSTSIPGMRKAKGSSLSQQMKDFVKYGARDPYEATGNKVGLLDRINPLKVAGGASSVDRFIPAQVGRSVGDLVEGSHRLGGFLALLRQGYDPAEAAKRIKLLHVDYGDLTGTERKYLRRLFPFYSFSKGMAKYLSNEIYTRPGGPVAQSVRAARLSREDDVTTPEYIAQGVSVPLGVGPDGSRNYLTGLGLMHESVTSQADSLFSMNPQRTLFEAGTMLNPLLKAPLEVMFNESLFQESPQGGRSLDDMDPALGRTLSNVGNFVGLTDRTDPVDTNKYLEAAISNSPLARVLSTARQVTDPRKGLLSRGLNTFTGLKTSTVSPAAQDAILRERAAELMRQLGGRSFERSYFPEEVKARMSPEDLEKAEMYESLMNLLAERAKQRKAIREMQEAQNL